MTTKRRRAVTLTAAALSTLTWAVVVPAVVGPNPMTGPSPASAAARMTATGPAVRGPADPGTALPDWHATRLHRYTFPGGGRITAI